MEKVRYMNQGIAIAEAAGLGGDRDAVEYSTVQDTARDSWNDFITQVNALYTRRAADERCRVSAGEDEGGEQQAVEPFAKCFRRDLPSGNAQDHMFAPSEGGADGLARGGVRVDQDGGSAGEERGLLGQGYGVIRTDAE